MLSRKVSLPDSPQPLQFVFDRAARKLSAKMSVKVRTALLFALASLSVQHATCDKSSRVTETGALRYLSQFGYLPPANPSKQGIITEEAMSKAISDFQSFAGLNLTGQLDDNTVHAMLLPRCGVKDRVGTSLSGRSKRYALQGSRWRVKKLTYRIGKYPQKITDKAAVDKEVAKAFGVWSAYTDLTFTPKKSGQVHIEIRFEKGEHGDGDPFDGPGGTLAHAYFPLYGGDAHFDDSEHWTINSFRGTNLFQVAAHEFGHSLGLSHSDVKSALMAPFYRGYNPAFTLDSDDISGIQALYGPKTSSGVGTEQRTTITPPAGKEDSQLCNDPKVDTMFNSAEGQTYAFKGDYYWKLTAEGVADGYPKIISQSWKGLPGNIDAAFTYKNGKTYFFKGSKYWRFIGKKMDGNYPKEISEGFTGIPDNLDAATTWTGNGKIYFYKGTKFWRFDPNQKPPVKSTYPKLISNWEGLPDNLDAALTYQGYTYFFKGNAYYRFNDRTFAVDRADPAFPRAIAYWWFGCRSARKGTLGNTSWKTNYDDDDLGYFSSNLDNVERHFHDDEHDDIHDDGDMSDIILDAGEADEHRVTSFYETATVSSARGLTSSPLWLLLFVKLTLFVTTYTNIN